ncbi:hypothetical protein [Arthrobacter sp. NPDC090010]|uniref:hypothetical protein n=1 Tax=Arthrobacter sp. NPDC090010 TaxID=3363942 RepID=UPI00380A9739
MTSWRNGPWPALVAALGDRPHHRDVEHALRSAGWSSAGAGDWAIALRSPDGAFAARISPFDPMGPYTARLYREAAATRHVPMLLLHLRLEGGGDLQIMEWLAPVPEDIARDVHQAIATGRPETAALAAIIDGVHEDARALLPWCGPLDNNPANVMRAADGHLVVMDLFYADGLGLYTAASETPELVAASIPEHERRYMTEIPLAGSGPWQPGEQERIRQLLLNADNKSRGGL